MSDINRPLRRLEIARRIQELRDRAAEDATPTGTVAPEAAEADQAAPDLAELGVVETPVRDPATDDEAAPGHHETRDGAPRHLARSDTDGGPGEESSAAATIASLLRGGQTWLLDRGR